MSQESAHTITRIHNAAWALNACLLRYAEDYLRLHTEDDRLIREGLEAVCENLPEGHPHKLFAAGVLATYQDYALAVEQFVIDAEDIEEHSTPEGTDRAKLAHACRVAKLLSGKSSNTATAISVMLGIHHPCVVEEKFQAQLSEQDKDKIDKRLTAMKALEWHMDDLLRDAEEHLEPLRRHVVKIMDEHHRELECAKIGAAELWTQYQPKKPDGNINPKKVNCFTPIDPLLEALQLISDHASALKAAENGRRPEPPSVKALFFGHTVIKSMRGDAQPIRPAEGGTPCIMQRHCTVAEALAGEPAEEALGIMRVNIHSGVSKSEFGSATLNFVERVAPYFALADTYCKANKLELTPATDTAPALGRIR